MINPRSVLVASLFLVGCALEPNTIAVHQAPLEGEDAGFVEPDLSPTRLVRRLQLALVGRPPTLEELDRIEAAPTEEARELVISALVDEDLESVEFYRQSIRFAHDWFRVGAHNAHANISHNYFTGHLSIELHACPMSTMHAGALGLLNSYREYGDPRSICDDPAAPIHMVSPWWSPSTPIAIIGRAGSATPQSAVRRNGTYDCGVASVGDRSNLPADRSANPTCGCGPNLVYCLPPKGGALANTYSFEPNIADSSRRIASEEVARLYAHIVKHDRPLSDFLVGNYTVAPLYLKHMYVRAARFDGANETLDLSSWWDPSTWTTPADPEHQAGSPLAWHEVVVESLHPNLLSLTNGVLASGDAALARSAKYDPRTEAASAFKGIPAAGALTSLVAQASFSRERVRAARWLETLTCRTFVPPDATQKFNDFKRDPATEGNCQHCHLLIDPAAVFFKRWGFAGNGIVHLGGFGRGGITATTSMTHQPFMRWQKAFDPDTVMTRTTAAQAAQNPNAVFIDFLSDSTTLFGKSGDGTYGPLGFGKILIESGEFDRCAARQLYERIVGPKLNVGLNERLVEQLGERFVANGRKVKPFIRELIRRPEFRKGL